MGLASLLIGCGTGNVEAIHVDAKTETSQENDLEEECQDCNPIDWSAPEASVKADDFYVKFGEDTYLGSDVKLTVSYNGSWGEGLYLKMDWEEDGYQMNVSMDFFKPVNGARCLKEVDYFRDVSLESGVGGFGYGYECGNENPDDPEDSDESEDPEEPAINGKLLINGKLNVDELYIPSQYGEIYFQNLEINVNE